MERLKSPLPECVREGELGILFSMILFLMAGTFIIGSNQMCRNSIFISPIFQDKAVDGRIDSFERLTAI